MNLETPLNQIRGINIKISKKLAELSLFTIKDILFFFPLSYTDCSSLKKINQLKINENSTIKAKIVDLKTKPLFKRRSLIIQALLKDETGTLRAVWFAKPYLEKIFLKGREFFFAGKVTVSKYGLSLIEPEFETIEKEEKKHLLRIIPHYREKKGLTSRFLRTIIFPLLKFSDFLPSFLPREIEKRYSLPTFSQAIKEIHWPSSFSFLKKAQTRIDLENLFILELFLLKRKISLKEKTAPIFSWQKEIDEFIADLPFKLTNDQKKVLQEIFTDLASGKPMNRILQGDVGSGKTIVALISSLAVALKKYQVAFMAPTEILAWQQFQAAKNFFKKIDLPLALLTANYSLIFWQGQESEVKKSSLQKEISQGKFLIVFGTHSLLQEKINFPCLSLIIIDEQHRFGVNQRALLAKKGEKITPHCLSMTATPIPRTLALSLYSDLDFSLIKESPQKRKIVTKITSPKNREKVYEFIRKKIKEGEQLFLVCPLIEESEKLSLESIEKKYQEIKRIFPEFSVAKLYGKMKGEEKQKVIEDFAKNKTKILVTTSVIEVGIDVPAANLMIIENPERFGLAQLHQIRGRIGRRGQQAFCFLFPEKLPAKTRARLKAIQESTDGFFLSQKDLEIRGPGEFLGIKQSGFPDYLMLALTNFTLIKIAKEAALNLLKKDPSLNRFSLLRERVEKMAEEISFS